MHKIKDFILDTDFTYKYFNDNLYISNFNEIIYFDNDKVCLKVDDKLFKIIGKNLVISKLLTSEILIKGKINELKFK